MADGAAPMDQATRRRACMPIAATLLVAVSVVFGGASRENPIPLAVVEVASLPLLALSVGGLVDQPSRDGARLPLIILGLTIAVPVCQLVPMPPALWTRLPGREAEIEALRLAGLALPWAPVSQFPHQTLVALLALTPPTAMFLATRELNPAGKRLMVWVWLALAVAGLVLGALQLAAPGAHPPYLYATTNAESLVGFFANRNHEAAVLLALPPLAVALALEAPPGAGAGNAMRWGLGAFCLLAIVGLGVVGSRAGLALAGPMVLGCAAMAWRAGGGTPGRRRLAALAGLGGPAVIGVLTVALSPIAGRLGAGGAADFRFEAWPYVEAGARPLLPVGAGVGAFDRVFRSVEPLAMVRPAYFNHAHNDYLELWLETGVFGTSLLAAFAVWLARVSWTAWRGQTRAPGHLARGASVSLALVLLHSLVDYPLRTTALATLFAFGCGVLAARDPPPASPAF